MVKGFDIRHIGRKKAILATEEELKTLDFKPYQPDLIGLPVQSLRFTAMLLPGLLLDRCLISLATSATATCEA